MMKHLIQFLILGCAFEVFAADRPVACTSTREFITTLEFMRDQKEFSLPEQQAREVADKVSPGCTGASKRFIRATNVLIKAGAPSKLAIETGIKFSASDEDALSAFLQIFKGSYLEDLLDLDLKTSLDIALELSHTFKGNRKNVQDDFSRLIKFCQDKNTIELPLAKCGRLAAKVVKSGELFDFRISKDFIALFEYLTKTTKTNLTTYQALEIIEYVVQFGPEAKDNFIKAYEYAMAKKGLDTSGKDAITFAKKMASRSVK